MEVIVRGKKEILKSLAKQYEEVMISLDVVEVISKKRAR